VFEKPERLALWLVDHPRGSDEGTSYENWVTFIKGEMWAPTMIMSSEKGVQSGVVAMAEKEKEPAEEPHE
jgi:hypothetical protein